MTNDFITQKPFDPFLSTLVDYYFFIDVAIDELDADQEYIVPVSKNNLRILL